MKAHAQKVAPDVISRLYDSVADFTIYDAENGNGGIQNE